MTPDNTHHDTLQVYFDFLEDNNVQTQELRLLESKTHHDFNFALNDGEVGVNFIHNVGSAGTNWEICYHYELDFIGDNYSVGTRFVAQAVGIPCGEVGRKEFTCVGASYPR